MQPSDSVNVFPQPWRRLRMLTDARIGLGRAGAGIPTGETLNFKLAHARARDAVHAALDVLRLTAELSRLHTPVLSLRSCVMDRSEYLRRPDLGRRLDEISRQTLQENADGDEGCDLALVIADGLSALAIERNAVPFLQAFLPMANRWELGPLAVVEQGRVAIGDDVGELLRAKAVAVLIGERPGLSSPDSMGIYLTYAPRIGLTDERRNCISNIRQGGLSWDAAAAKLAWLITESLHRRLSGVELKDETTSQALFPAEAALKIQ